MIGVKILKEKINYLFGNRQVYWFIAALSDRYYSILCPRWWDGVMVW